MSRSIQLSEATERLEPMLATQWVVDALVIGIHGIANDKSRAVDAMFTTRWLRSHVESLDIPFKLFDVDNRHIQASRMYYAGFNNVNAFNMSFYENIYGQTLAKFLAWQDLISDKESNYSVPALYKANMRMSILDGNKFTDQDTVIVDLKGIWPSQIDPFSLSSDNSDRLIVKVTMSIDEINIKVNNPHSKE